MGAGTGSASSCFGRQSLPARFLVIPIPEGYSVLHVVKITGKRISTIQSVKAVTV